MSIELIAEESDALSLGLGGVGEGEGLEAASLVVPRIVPETESPACRERPSNVNAAGKHAEQVSVAGGDVDEHVVREDGCVEENEEAVLGGFDGRNVTAQARQGGAKVGAGLAVDPPVIAVCGTVVLVAFGLDVIDDVLVDGGKSVTHFLGSEPK